MPRNKDLLYWNKKDGEKVLIEDMSNDYLLQTLKNLENQSKDKGKLITKNLPTKYYALKMHAMGRGLIKK